MADHPSGRGERIQCSIIRQAEESGFNALSCVRRRERGFNGRLCVRRRRGFQFEPLSFIGWIEEENGFPVHPFLPAGLTNNDWMCP